MSRPKLFKATVWKKKAKRIWIYESKLILTKTNFIPELREVRLEVSYRIGPRQRPKSETRPWLGRELSRQRREQRVSICVECAFFWTIRWIGSLFAELIGNKIPNNKSEMRTKYNHKYREIPFMYLTFDTYLYESPIPSEWLIGG